MSVLIDNDNFHIFASDGICYVELNSKENKNAITLGTAEIMSFICEPPKDKSSIKSVFEVFLTLNNCFLIVVHSLVENIFSSGGDLSDLLKSDKISTCNYGESVRKFCNLLHHTHIPSVAILNGPSYGGGAELALATDFRFAIGDNYDFYFAQTKFGVPGGWGGMQRLSELCPQFNTRKVSLIFLSQMKLDVEQLNKYGIIDKEFSDKKSCYEALNKWKKQISVCHKGLREDLMLRSEIENLNEYDIQIFNKYFLQESHKKSLEKFFVEKI